MDSAKEPQEGEEVTQGLTKEKINKERMLTKSPSISGKGRQVDRLWKGQAMEERKRK